MARYVDLICLFVGLITLWLSRLVLKKRLKEWRPLTRIVIALILATIPAGVLWGLFGPGAVAKGEPGVVTRLDPITGRPIEVLGKLTGKLTQPGDYRVNFPQDRYAIVHISPGKLEQDSKLKPGEIAFCGDDENDPEAFAFRYTRMREQADRRDLIVGFPMPQSPYSVLGEPHYAWNSEGTLSRFNPKRQDEADFFRDVRDWLLKHTNVDPNRLSLGGLSGGSLLAQVLAQKGQIAIKLLFLIGGTMLSGQENRHPYENGPEIVLVQYNPEDDKVMPLETKDGRVVPGKMYLKATLGGGYWGLGNSLPGKQGPFWIVDAIGHGGKEASVTPIIDPDGNWRMEIHEILTASGKTKYVILWWVFRGGHAWHGDPDGGDEDEGLVPNVNVPLDEAIAYLASGNPVSGLKALLLPKSQ